MNAGEVVELLRQAFWTSFWLGLPLLAVCFAAGVLISLVQIVTAIQDASFNTAPRLIAFLLGVVIFLPWMMARMINYTAQLFGDFSRYAR